jgi:hypothetical protein
MWLPSRRAWLIPHELAAGEERVEHAPGRERAAQSADPDEPEFRVDGDLGELRPEGEQSVRRVERWRAPRADGLGVGQVVAGEQLAVGVCRVWALGRGQASVCDRHRARIGPVQR